MNRHLNFARGKKRMTGRFCEGNSPLRVHQSAERKVHTVVPPQRENTTTAHISNYKKSHFTTIDHLYHSLRPPILSPPYNSPRPQPFARLADRHPDPHSTRLFVGGPLHAHNLLRALPARQPFSIDHNAQPRLLPVHHHLTHQPSHPHDDIVPRPPLRNPHRR